jgi:hypothetical protein
MGNWELGIGNGELGIGNYYITAFGLIFYTILSISAYIKLPIT